MKKVLVGLAVLPFLTGVALAAQPIPLSDAQMDKVTAGQGDGSIAVFTGAGAVVLGNLDAKSATVTNTLASKEPSCSTCDLGNNTGFGLAAAEASGASAITASFVKAGSNAVAGMSF
jgi:hypothetical protein